MKKEKMFSPEQYAVLIPYKDLTRLLETLAQMEEMHNQIKRMDERYAAMQLMFSEVLEKVAEINRYL